MPAVTTKRLVWLTLAAPAAVFAAMAARLPAPDWEELLHPTGELSARLLILALAATPLLRLFPGSRIVRFLVRHRRAVGVAAFGYAALHLLFYAVAMGTLSNMLAEIGAPGIWTGWLALLLMLPLAITSNDRSQRLLAAGWKRLQRLAYPVALLTLAHWALIHDDAVAALLHFVPLALLQLARVRRPRFTTGEVHA